MLFFKDWTLRTDGQVIAQQFDNLTRTLAVTGDVPTDWEWAMLVQIGDAMDILPLAFMQEGLGIVLTAKQLSIPGYCTMQLRATRGELVRHTNIIHVYIPASLSGDMKWPEVPSEFTDLERRATEAVHKAEKAAGEAETAARNVAESRDVVENAVATTGQNAANAAEAERVAEEHKNVVEQAALRAEGYSAHPPIIGENGNWWGWNGAQYVDSGKPSQGELTMRQGGNLYTNALKGTARGVAVRVDDASPLEHGVPVRVRSKNLCPKASITTAEHVDGAIHMNVNQYPYLLSSGSKTFTLSADVTVYPDDTAAIMYFDLVAVYEDGTATLGRIFTTNKEDVERLRDGVARHYSVSVSVDPTKTLKQLALKPLSYAHTEGKRSAEAKNIQLEQGTTATDYTPHISDLSTVTVYQHGKNLCHEASVTAEEDRRGRVFLLAKDYPQFAKPGIAYRLSANVTVYADDTPTTRFFDLEIHYADGTNTFGRIMFEDASTIRDGITRHYSVVAKTSPNKEISQIVIVTLGCSGDSSQFLHAKAENIQLEVGDTETAYEPYIAPVTYTVAEDGTCEITSIAPTMTLTTDNPNVVMECEYNRDINNAYDRLVQAIISMGGNI